MKTKKPKLEPEVFVRAAEYVFWEGPHYGNGACLAVEAVTLCKGFFEYEDYADFFYDTFKPRWVYKPDYWMNYDNHQLELPDGLVWERRMLALLLCAEMIKHP